MSSEQEIIDYTDKLKALSLDSLRDLKASLSSTVLGIIVHVGIIKQSTFGKKDYICPVRISDPSLRGRQMRLNLFNAKKECFPKDMSPGDIIVLKNLKVELYNHSYFGVSQPSTVYTVYKQDTLVQLPIPDIECDMTEAEEDIVEALDLWYAEKKASMKNTAIVASGVRPYLRTDQLLSHPTKFFDYIGMVVSYKKDNLNPVVNLTLTDFTKNMAPIKLKQVQYPIDREFLLHCTLWDNNAVNCPPLVYGDYVRICNGVKRLSKEGSAEFRVNGDRDNGRKLTKLSADDHLLKDLLKRKKEYSSR